MKIRALLFICCTSFMVSAVSAQKQTGTDTPKETIHIVKMDKRVSELMADRVTIRKDMGLKELAEINARVDESLAANEALLFPADELYGSNWDTRWVDPFRGGAKVEMIYPTGNAGFLRYRLFNIYSSYRYNDARYL